MPFQTLNPGRLRLIFFNHIRLSTLLGLLVILSACHSTIREYKETFFVFGTIVDVTLYDVDAQTAANAFSVLNDDFQRMHRMWHPWNKGALQRTNQLLETTAEFSYNPSILDLIERSRKLAHDSHNLYNPAIGKLLDLWGFHSDEPPTGPPPSKQAIEALVKLNPQISDITVSGVRMRSSNPSVKLDFGAMAKGLAIDMELNYLKSVGIHNAILNAGGDLKAIGQHGERHWKVAIRDPRSEGMLANLDVFDGEAVFTSGDYERYFESEDHHQRFHHILDPRTGYPAKNAISVTVIHSDAATADAAATALLIAGSNHWQEIAKSMGIDYVLLVDKNKHMQLTQKMAQRLNLSTKHNNVTIFD
jgi:thiamine biosynthesis lipoprotein